MRFKRLFAESVFKDFPDDDHIALTHEILTGHGYVQSTGASGEHYRRQGHGLNTEDLHRDLQSAGWKHKEYAKDFTPGNQHRTYTAPGKQIDVMTDHMGNDDYRSSAYIQKTRTS